MLQKCNRGCPKKCITAPQKCNRCPQTLNRCPHKIWPLPTEIHESTRFSELIVECSYFRDATALTFSILSCITCLRMDSRSCAIPYVFACKLCCNNRLHADLECCMSMRSHVSDPEPRCPPTETPKSNERVGCYIFSKKHARPEFNYFRIEFEALRCYLGPYIITGACHRLIFQAKCRAFGIKTCHT